MIDLIFVNSTANVTNHGTLPKIADHDGILVSYYLETEKPIIKTKLVYDYNKVDVNGLIDYIKHFDYDTSVFQYPVLNHLNYTQKF